MRRNWSSYTMNLGTAAMSQAKMLALFLLQVLSLSCLSESLGFREEVMGGILEVDVLLESCVEGSFTDLETHHGIRFVSKPDMLSVTTLDGTPLLSAEEPSGINRVVSVGRTSFVQQKHHSRGGSSDYAVPDSMKRWLKRGHRTLRRLARRLETSRREVHADALRIAIEDLLLKPEIRLIERCAFALGGEDITGREYPAILPFYVAALHLTRLTGPGDAIRSSNQRSRRAACLSLCPPCPNDDCLGMCGLACSCWSFLCGDCCYHLGCYDHDVCCRMRFFQSACIFPLGFKCSSHYYCQ